jgi:ribosomal protein S18 acetylase RimI-like enzyme
MLEHQNTKPAPISKDDAPWIKPLYVECFGKEDPWLERLGDCKYEAYQINKRAFIFTYIVEDQTDLLTIGVDREARKQGLATLLINWVIDKAPAGQKIFLDVECQNIAAISLYKKIGFESISIRKGYYPQNDGTAIDALVMAYQKAT